MSKRPRWIKFNLDDFCDDHAVKSCPLDTQGWYVHLMRLLTRSDPYGYLVIGGVEPPLKLLGNLTGYHSQTCKKHLEILKGFGVLKKDENGYWYSKRMVEEWLEYQENKAHGEMGGNPQLMLEGVNPPVNPEVKPPLKANQMENQKENKNKKKIVYSAKFEEGWNEYPRKLGKAASFRAWNARVKEGEKEDNLILSARNYDAECIREKREEQFIKHPATFWGRDRHYEDYLGNGQGEGRTLPQIEEMIAFYRERMDEVEARETEDPVQQGYDKDTIRECKQGIQKLEEERVRLNARR